MLFAWYNRLVFDWMGSNAKGVDVDIGDDSDSGIEDAILQMDDLQLNDDEEVVTLTSQLVIYLFVSDN